MQGITYQQITSSMPQRGAEILHYSLAGLLPAGHTLATNILLGTLSLIAQDAAWPYPRLLGEQQFTMSELSLLLPLLDSHPHYCPYEVLLASFNYRLITEETIERGRQHLQDAQEEGLWDQEMRPVRNVLSRTRLKMRVVGVEIASILETGYVLMALPARRRLGTCG
ncbi:MAG: hypothetical protein ACRDIV_23030 [Ktedonobacteraceae bacterium]